MLRHMFKITFLVAGCILVSIVTYAQKMAFTISMPNPATHYYHLSMRCEGMKKDSVEFRMPVWTTGYYQVLDFANYVENFRASDEKGSTLQWEKSAKNAW